VLDMPQNTFNTQKVCLKKNTRLAKKIKNAFKGQKSLKMAFFFFLTKA
jgi:hypothetical protein